MEERWGSEILKLTQLVPSLKHSETCLWKHPIEHVNENRGKVTVGMGYQQTQGSYL